MLITNPCGPRTLNYSMCCREYMHYRLREALFVELLNGVLRNGLLNNSASSQMNARKYLSVKAGCIDSLPLLCPYIVQWKFVIDVTMIGMGEMRTWTEDTYL